MMMNLRRLCLAGVGVVLGLLAGCGGSNSGVQVVAPSGQHALQGKAPDDGQYAVYRAYGFDESNYPRHVEQIWVVQASRGEPMGFRWRRPANEWDPNGKMTLEAYVGSQTRDVGAIRHHDEKILWAGANANLNGYWQAMNNEEVGRRMTMQ
jgi:hypothetical protein